MSRCNEGFKSCCSIALALLLLPEDILSPLGLIRHLFAAMHIAQGGLATLGVVCSTWVAINRDLDCLNNGLGELPRMFNGCLQLGLCFIIGLGIVGFEIVMINWVQGLPRQCWFKGTSCFCLLVTCNRGGTSGRCRERPLGREFFGL